MDSGINSQLEFVIYKDGLAVVSIGTYEDSKFIGMTTEELKKFAEKILKAIE